jgi:hypothetical protein
LFFEGFFGAGMLFFRAMKLKHVVESLRLAIPAIPALTGAGRFLSFRV